MFERFTTAAREVVIRAQQEARALGHGHIGTEHVLIALVADPDGAVATALRDKGVTADFVRDEARRKVERTPPLSPVDADAEDKAALKAIGIDLDAVRAAIEQNFGAGALKLPRPAPKKRGLFGRFYAGTNHVPFTKRNKKVLELSLREAIRLNQKFIAPEHIALGLIREGEGLAMLILSEKEVDFDRLRDDLTRSLRSQAA
ncbi:Clp protease N-terminal domain-containing protein [Paractinoplanes atraurantiacus]|uniref:Clp amino terminal domain-containing protein, pathogenicity island component n=1 Tax=Paractinoplanes atraurantiacus TaxID=1036182 RepID=A0A285JM98_9ACTN|nr:Clp protease N-terminal domain-containing protein [Actinoplanes atraurantiacus]SNY60221.1 Clp amino terminal domain-containing protein, pathogenicity island component [Actinoplanes atraurantiacus]